MPNHTYRVQRGRILKILYQVFPEGANAYVLFKALEDCGIPSEAKTFEGHLAYLKDRELIKAIDEDCGKLTMKTAVVLTHQGVEFVEADKNDKFIDMGVE